MTEQELETIEHRAAMATPGPWSVYAEFSVILVKDIPGPASLRATGEDVWFINEARDVVPKLIAEIRSLKGLISGLVTISNAHKDLGIPAEYLRDALAEIAKR
jgi:hypothetical protein